MWLSTGVGQAILPSRRYGAAYLTIYEPDVAMMQEGGLIDRRICYDMKNKNISRNFPTEWEE
jgi:hypothetical protein